MSCTCTSAQIEDTYPRPPAIPGPAFFLLSKSLNYERHMADGIFSGCQKM